MKTVTVTGASDDLIEVEGGLREEFDWYSDKPCWLNFSDGTQLKALYDDEGIWRFERTREGAAEYSRTPGDGEANDIVTLTGDVRWVEKWSKPAIDRDCLESWFEKFVDDADSGDFTDEQLRAIYAAATGRSAST